MLIKKIKSYARSKGIKALFVKLGERLEYKLETRAYIKNNKITNEDILKQQRAVFKRDVIVSICVPVYNTPKRLFEEMLNSVLNQSCGRWQLCIADGSTGEYSYIEDIVKSKRDKRITYKKLDKNLGIVANSNEACNMADGEYIALLDHDDVLSIDAIYNVKRAIDDNADFIYSDEASFYNDTSNPSIIHFKPDFSIFNLRGNNYICHLSVFKKSLFNEVGGFRNGFDGSQDHDIILRMCERAEKIVHIPRVLYYWRIHKNSVAMDISAKPYCITTGVKAVSDHIKRMGLNASVTEACENSAVYRVDYSPLITPTVINNIKLIDVTDREYIVVAHRDLELNLKAVEELGKYIQLKNVGAVCGVIIDGKKIASAGIGIKEGKAYYEYGNTSIYSEGYMKKLKYAHSVASVTPQLFAIKKSLYNAVGGFDTGLNDTENIISLSQKLKKLGYEIICNPYCVAFGKIEDIKKYT